MLSEGTNDSAAQVSQIETLISQKPDVLVILPHEGGPLTPIAQKAMQAGIPVVNVDREFSTRRPTGPGSAATTTASASPPPTSSPTS